MLSVLCCGLPFEFAMMVFFFDCVYASATVSCSETKQLDKSVLVLSVGDTGAICYCLDRKIETLKPHNDDQ